MTNQEIVRSLLGMGMNKAQIAKLVGRNSRVITHIERGEKPYRNLSGVLSDIHERAQEERAAGRRVDPSALTPQTEAPRRRAKSGKAARVRGAKRFSSGGFTVSVGASSCRAGAPSLVPYVHAAHYAGMRTAFTLSFRTRRGGAPAVRIERKSGGKGKGHHAPPPTNAKPPKPDTWTEFQVATSDLMERLDATGGNLSVALLDYAEDEGWLSYDEDVDPVNELVRIEMRAWPE